MATIVRLDKIGADTHIVSIEATKDLENGRVVSLGDLAVDGEAYKAATVAKDTIIAFHASTALVYEEGKTEADFILKKGEVGRGYILRKGDVVTISKDGFKDDITVGKYAVVVAGKEQLEAKATVDGTELMVFRAVAKEFLGEIEGVVVEVVKA